MEPDVVEVEIVVDVVARSPSPVFEGDMMEFVGVGRKRKKRRKEKK
jgi:hypothetical protein